MAFFTPTTILILMGMMMFAVIGVFLIVVYPVLFWPIKATIIRMTRGGYEMRNDVAKYYSHPTLGRVLKFHKNKDAFTKKAKNLPEFKNEHFITRGTFMPKKHINIFEKDDGTWHPMSLDLQQESELFRVDLRDTVGEFISEQQNILEQTKNVGIWAENKGIITIFTLGIMVMLIIALGGKHYLDLADKRANALREMGEDPARFCKDYYAPIAVTGQVIKPLPVPVAGLAS